MKLDIRISRLFASALLSLAPVTSATAPTTTAGVVDDDTRYIAYDAAAIGRHSRPSDDFAFVLQINYKVQSTADGPQYDPTNIQKWENRDLIRRLFIDASTAVRFDSTQWAQQAIAGLAE